MTQLPEGFGNPWMANLEEIAGSQAVAFWPWPAPADAADVPWR